jgi:hypothetical protein
LTALRIIPYGPVISFFKTNRLTHRFFDSRSGVLGECRPFDPVLVQTITHAIDIVCTAWLFYYLNDALDLSSEKEGLHSCPKQLPKIILYIPPEKGKKK